MRLLQDDFPTVACQCHSVPQCATVCHSVPQCATVCHSVPQCATVCHSVPQCATVPDILAGAFACRLAKLPRSEPFAGLSCCQRPPNSATQRLRINQSEFTLVIGPCIFFAGFTLNNAFVLYDTHMEQAFTRVCNSKWAACVVPLHAVLCCRQ